ncbi:MAG: RNA-binding protein [archaeon]|nr:RNA-binding protein [archaeon]
MQKEDSTILEQSYCDSLIEKMSITVEDSYFIQNSKDNFMDYSFENEIFSVFREMKPIKNLENDDTVEDEPTHINIPRKFNCANLRKNSRKNSCSSSSSIIYQSNDDEEEDRDEMEDLKGSLLRSSKISNKSNGEKTIKIDKTFKTDESLNNTASSALLSNFDLSQKFSANKLINVANIISGEEKRTTVIIRNVPKKYMPIELLNELMSLEELNGKFNFFYLPYNAEKGLNMGFAIINFTSPFHLALFFEMYQKKNFKCYASPIPTGITLQIYFLKCKKMFLNEIKSNVPDESQMSISLPIKFLKLFKTTYNQSVCLIKNEKTFNGIPIFRVQTFGEKKTL